jgi:CubicO group peptidase (beta-lactamase class C family)
MLKRPVLAAALAVVGAAASAKPATETRWTPASVDAAAMQAMAETGARGLALAVVENGQVALVRSYGVRNAKGDPLTADTVMYGASLTKAAFGYLVMQLVEEGRLDLDAPISRYLPKALPDYPADERYGPWPDLTGDERWRAITPRILLTHSAGFANYEWDEPDGRLRIHFAPGSRYAYSGTGMILLQFVLEQGLGIDVGTEMQQRVFDRFAMTNTSMMWRSDFAGNVADGWDASGKVEPHDERSKVRAAGSMDTSITDMGRLAAGYVRGDGLSSKGRRELTKPILPITTNTQFPSMQAELPVDRRHRSLAAGLGVVVYDGPQGHAFFKGGHNDTTGNTWVCVERRRSCVVILANDVRAEAAFPRLVRHILGETGTPWSWEYGRARLQP